MVLIDSDVLLLAFAFQQDERQAENATFLARAAEKNLAITVYNLMEILGKLSFNLSPARLDDWQSWLVDAFRLVVIWPETTADEDAESFFRDQIFDRPYAEFRTHRMAFMDALIIDLAERTPDIKYFVTWNARHFRSKTSLSVATPSEYLAQIE